MLSVNLAVASSGDDGLLEGVGGEARHQDHLLTSATARVLLMFLDSEPPAKGWVQML